MQHIKGLIKPIIILTIAFLMTAVVVGMIAYANCEEAKLFIDNILSNSVEVSNLRQA